MQRLASAKPAVAGCCCVSLADVADGMIDNDVEKLVGVLAGLLLDPSAEPFAGLGGVGKPEPQKPASLFDMSAPAATATVTAAESDKDPGAEIDADEPIEEVEELETRPDGHNAPLQEEFC